MRDGYTEKGVSKKEKRVRVESGNQLLKRKYITTYKIILFSYFTLSENSPQPPSHMTFIVTGSSQQNVGYSSHLMT